MIAPPLETDERHISTPAILRVGASVALPSQVTIGEEVEDSDDEVFIFPATLAQRRFWLLEQMTPGGNSALNMSVAMRLRGRLAPQILERAFNEIIARHESLRTVFHTEDGKLCQIISPEQFIRLMIVDPEDFPAGERARVPDHLLREEVETPFDLVRGPLVRARLVRLGRDEHLLLITTHHIICDGWSNRVLLGELTALYDAFSQGRPSPLPDLPLQYADFAQWQEEILGGGGLDPQLAYWRKQLADLPPCLDLPLDHPRKPVRGMVEGNICWRPLPEPLAASLKSVAQSRGATGYMLSLAVFATLLHRYCGGQEDIVLSSPAAGRSRAELEGMIGLFASPLLLRLDLSGNPTFGELLTRVRATVLAAFANSDVPFERLLEENLHLRRLQVNYLHQTAFVQPAHSPDLDWTPVRPASGGATMDWTAGIEERADGAQLFLEYNTGLFDDSTVERVLAHFEGLLAAVTAPGGLDTPIGSLPLLTSVVTANSKPTAVLASRWRLAEESCRWLEKACASDAHSSRPAGGEPVFGLAREGVRLLVLDHRMEPMPIGVAGEIFVAGMTETDGLPADSFVADPRAAGARLFKTGDAGRWLANGDVKFLGRADRQFKLNGARVEPGPIEAALREHPRIHEAVLISHVPAGAGTVRLIAYLQAEPDSPAALTSEECHDFLRERFTEDAIPGAFVVLERFPMTPDGRLDEAALPAPGTPVADGSHGGAPFLTIHYQLIDIWQEVLGVQGIGTRDNFFALGGNSLLAMRMLNLIERSYGKTLQPATLFKQATVEYLAEEIIRQDASANHGKTPPLIALQERGARTPMFYLHGDLTGGGYYCMKLAAGLGQDQPFYAVPPVDIGGYREHLPSIEEMAATHLRAIRAVRPQGPYVIGGFCLGGLVAYEVARQLEIAGETVEKLVIIDATALTPRLAHLRRFAEWRARRRGLDNVSRLHVFCKGHFLLARLERWKGLKAGEQWEIARRRLGGAWNRLGRLLTGKAPAAAEPVPTPLSVATTESLLEAGKTEGPSSWFNPRWDVPLVFLWAAGGYRIKPYGGPLELLLSRDLNDGEDGRHVRDWQRLAPGTRMTELPGSHLACITKHVGELAGTIRRVLES